MQYKEGDLPTAQDTLDRAVEQWREIGDPNGLAESLRFAGMTALFRGDMERAGTAIDEALGLFRTAHDRRGEAWALQNLAWLAFLQGEYTKAETRLEVSAEAFGEVGDWGGVSWALGLLAWVRFVQGNHAEARDLATRMEQEAAELGNRWAGAMMNVLLANIAVWAADPAQAGTQAESALEIFRSLGDPWGELQAMSPLLVSRTQAGRYLECLELIDEIETLGFQVADASLNRMPGMIRAATAVMAGDERALEIANSQLGDLDGPLFINDEQRMLLGLANLQSGNVEAGLDNLAHARAVAIGAGSDAATDVAYTLALIANGDAATALEVAAASAGELVTYADRYRHALARAFAHHLLGDLDQSDDALLEAPRGCRGNGRAHRSGDRGPCRCTTRRRDINRRSRIRGALGHRLGADRLGPPVCGDGGATDPRLIGPPAALRRRSASFSERRVDRR